MNDFNVGYRQLELVEGVVGMFALSLSGVIPLAVENGEEEEEISVETDYPNPDHAK